jgi:serine/threonine-protein kinase
VAQTEEAPQVLVAGKYRLTQLIGRGGMGSVWEGTHTTLGTHVAVKFIEAEYVNSVEARNRFENEARAAAKLRSKHVVEVYDHGVTDDGRPFIVMEYLRGEPLDKRLERVGRIPPKDTARLTLQVCRALSKAHAGGIVHRDLKPENVFLVWDDEDGADVAKVVDFGIAKFTDGGLGSSSATRTGSVLGTPYYMSPEQARGLRSVDHRSDLWSVGVIAYRCLVGTLPFEGEAVGDLLVKLCTAPLPIPSQVAPDVPPGFDAWFAKALCREPERRFSSATELANALAAVCGLPVRGAYSTNDIPIPSYAGGPMASSSPAITPAGALLTPQPHVVADRTGSNPALGPFVDTGSTLQIATGAPTTQTPAPVAKRNTSAIVAAAGAAVVVLGVGIALLVQLNGSGSTASAASATPGATEASLMPAASAPAPVAARTEPANSAEPASSAVAAAPAALAPAPAAQKPSAPVTPVKPVRPSVTRPPAPKVTPRPDKTPPKPERPAGSDVGF